MDMHWLVGRAGLGANDQRCGESVALPALKDARRRRQASIHARTPARAETLPAVTRWDARDARERFSGAGAA